MRLDARGWGTALLGVSLLACGPKHPGVDDGASESDTGDDSSESETESDESTTETGAETETGEPEPDPDLPPPDLPPDSGCVPFAEAQEFDELCFGEPLIIDPHPVHYVEAVYWDDLDVEYDYVGGVDLHRFHASTDLIEGGDHVELDLPGTAVQARRLSYFSDVFLFGILTKDPATLILVEPVNDFAIHSVFELEAEPTSLTVFVVDIDELESKRMLAVADVDATLHLFEIVDGALVRTATRGLPEPLEQIDATFGWFQWDHEPGRQLIARSSVSLTAWFLSPPIDVDGPIDAYPLPYAISTWQTGPFSDVGSPDMLLFSEQPSQATFFPALEFDDPGYTIPLAHPVTDFDGGELPMGAAGTFVFSRADQRVGHFGTWYGEGGEYQDPSHWIAAPQNSEDFLALGSLGFLFASTSEGLVLVGPSP